MTRFLTSSVPAILALFGAIPATAQQAPVIEDLVQIELIEGWRRADGTHVAGLHLSLAPGWQTYWRAPGDSGIPPRFTWTGSQNVAAQNTVWPVPEVHVKNGLRTIGYTGDVVLPMLFSAKDASQPITLSGTVEIGVCEKVCIPVSLELDGVLPAEGDAKDATLSAALKDVPQTAKKAGVRKVSCKVAPTRDGLMITASVDMASAGGREVLVFEHPDKSLWISEAETERNGQVLTARSEFVSVNGGPFPLDRSDIRITVLGTKKAVDIHGCPAG